jgi:hypothetical protein
MISPTLGRARADSSVVRVHAYHYDYIFYGHSVLFFTLTASCFQYSYVSVERPCYPERGLLPVLYEGLFPALATQLVAQGLQSTERGEFLPSSSMMSLLEASQQGAPLFFFLSRLPSSHNQTSISQLIGISKIFSPNRGAAIQLVYINKWGLLGGHSHIKRPAHDTSSDLFTLQILW